MSIIIFAFTLLSPSLISIIISNQIHTADDGQVKILAKEHFDTLLPISCNELHLYKFSFYPVVMMVRIMLLSALLLVPYDPAQSLALLLLNGLVSL